MLDRWFLVLTLALLVGLACCGPGEIGESRSHVPTAHEAGDSDHELPDGAGDRGASSSGDAYPDDNGAGDVVSSGDTGDATPLCTSDSQCDDDDDCTEDTCNPTTGCQHEPIDCDTFCRGNDVLLREKLTENETIGTQRGGSFSNGGWNTQTSSDQISWDLHQAAQSGSLEFEARGMSPNVGGCFWGVCYFVGLFEEASGNKVHDYTGSAVIEGRYHTNNQQNFHDTFKLQVGVGNGHLQEPMMTPNSLNWSPSSWHTYRYEWGSGVARFFIDGQEKLSAGYSRVVDWRYLFLGTTNYKGVSWGPTGMTYRNLCLRSGDGDVDPDPDPDEQDYSLSQLVQMPRYLWHLTSVDGQLYSGTYGDPTNSFYSISTDGSYASLTIDSQGESTRVYNLGGAFYSTSEGGKVFFDGAIRGDLGGHYVLAAAYHAGRHLISRSPRSDDSRAELWDCTGSGCSLWTRVSNIRAYHMTVFENELYLLGREPKGSSGYNTGRARVIRYGSGIIFDDTTGGIAVRGTVFNGELFVGITNNARIKSYDGASWTHEKGFPGFHHLGDLIVYDGKLFAVVVQDGGSAEVWSRNTAGTWTRVFDQSDLAGYGVLSGIPFEGSLVVLNNAAGFFAVADNKLYLSLNTPTSMRSGPGFILEIEPTP